MKIKLDLTEPDDVILALNHLLLNLFWEYSRYLSKKNPSTNEIFEIYSQQEAIESVDYSDVAVKLLRLKEEDGYNFFSGLSIIWEHVKEGANLYVVLSLLMDHYAYFREHVLIEQMTDYLENARFPDNESAHKFVQEIKRARQKNLNKKRADKTESAHQKIIATARDIGWGQFSLEGLTKKVLVRLNPNHKNAPVHGYSERAIYKVLKKAGHPVKRLGVRKYPK